MTPVVSGCLLRVVVGIFTRWEWSGFMSKAEGADVQLDQAGR